MRRGRHDPAGGVCCATPRNARRLAARWRAVCVRHFGLIPRPLVVCIPASGRALACSLSNVVRPRAQTMQACSDAAGSSTRRRSEAAPGDAARRRTQQAAPGVVVSSTRCRSDAARRRSRAGGCRTGATVAARAKAATGMAGVPRRAAPGGQRGPRRVLRMCARYI